VLERLARLIPPPRVHRHRYHGVLPPSAARLRWAQLLARLYEVLPLLRSDPRVRPRRWRTRAGLRVRSVVPRGLGRVAARVGLPTLRRRPSSHPTGAMEHPRSQSPRSTSPTSLASPSRR
jgi:hypothetical protein